MKRLTTLFVLFHMSFVSVIAQGTSLSAITGEEIEEYVKEIFDEVNIHITSINSTKVNSKDKDAHIHETLKLFVEQEVQLCDQFGNEMLTPAVEVSVTNFRTDATRVQIKPLKNF